MFVGVTLPFKLRAVTLDQVNTEFTPATVLLLCWLLLNICEKGIAVKSRKSANPYSHACMQEQFLLVQRQNNETSTAVTRIYSFLTFNPPTLCRTLVNV